MFLRYTTHSVKIKDTACEKNQNILSILSIERFKAINGSKYVYHEGIIKIIVDRKVCAIELDVRSPIFNKRITYTSRFTSY